MRVLFMLIAFLIVAAVIGGVVMVRTATDDATVWHVNPLEAPTPATPNSFRVVPVLGGQPQSAERVDMEAPIYAANPAIIALALDEFALRQPRTERIAGTPESGWMTYVQRSDLMRYPDYVSVMIFELEDGNSTIALFSRSRFGHGDMGVNGDRMRRWLGTLSSFEVQ
ncbi:uncharacterized protein (DUF1499 family) [Rubricella aquisinus]|uniref:Uncharacterized protein (DUF1499 family) n=1 Tax=Rubricella aquisinus TaxID=2028108 RepID=A0A840WIJ2_9RHOB|nr:DUF1499 domain-containing protein [Rubricella aquisinus]MBB5514938.1 uncharacterized protein (DUF1499 family) [Rubricella aquisinus]